MKTGPFSFRLDAPRFIPSEYDNYIKRTLSAMKGQYLDQTAYHQMLAEDDLLLYEVYELQRPKDAGRTVTRHFHLFIPVKSATNIS